MKATKVVAGYNVQIVMTQEEAKMLRDFCNSLQHNINTRPDEAQMLSQVAYVILNCL